MSIRDLPQTQTASIHAFMLMLVGILCLSIAPVASGFMSLQQEGIDLTRWLTRCTRNIGTLATSMVMAANPMRRTTMSH